MTVSVEAVFIRCGACQGCDASSECVLLNRLLLRCPFPFPQSDMTEPQRDPRPASAPGWQQQRERGAPALLKLLIGIARLAGRRCTRLLLFPIVLYFLCAGGAARAASKDYLRRVLGREPGLVDHARHLYCFAACTLDRVFLLGRTHSIRITRHRSEEVRQVERQSGCLLVASHLGSFEALRAPVARDPQWSIRILMDRRHNATATRLLETLAPELAAQVIDAGQGGPQLVLALREALAAGCMVGIMGDRVREGERSAEVDFLGGKARIPVSPWILASVLKVPVILGFSLYRRGGTYDNFLEVFAERIDLPRKDRDAALQAVAQRYATRLEHHLRLAPYNWFNWYHYWGEPGDPHEPNGGDKLQAAYTRAARP